jgi:CHASE3 domain sensor protein
MKTIKFINLIFLCAALVLILLSVFSTQRINKQVRASDRVAHTQLVKFKLNDAFSHLIETETAQRGFILSHDSSFLRDYISAQQEIPRLLSQIKILVADNPQQLGNFNIASNLFNVRLRYIEHTLANHKKLSVKVLDSVLVKGKLITDSLNRKIDRMINLENDLLEQHLVIKQAEESRSSAIILFSFNWHFGL